MEHPKPKAVLIAELGASRAELELVITQVPPERMTEPGACGSWSVKAVLAHLAVENDWLALQLERRHVGKAPAPRNCSAIRSLDWLTTRRATRTMLTCTEIWTWLMCVTGIAG